ncbi:hypothetical protein [Streptomyces sp. NBC_01238]|uniref:hypothetical protein n=1 Tax=Streptomyces sp. NBC_01238 TaxID=2903791 RepID=UPI002F907C49
MSAPLTPEREAEYRALIARTTDLGALVASPGVLQELLAELDRVRAELADRQEDLAFLHRNTLPELRRESQRHEDGKKRWRDRAEKAEAALAAKPAQVLRDLALIVVDSCPDHQPADTEGSWMDCHCPVADEFRRMAAVTAAVSEKSTRTP